MYTQETPLVFGSESLYLTQGVLIELQVARTTVNLLEQIDKHVKARSFISGVAAATTGLYGVAANSASLALYDGEETFHFAGMLNDVPICGTFQHADNLVEGDQVTAVVSKRGDALFTHAIMNSKREFYMPLNVFSSNDGMLAHCMQFAFKFTIALWVILYSMAGFAGAFSSEIELDTRVIIAVMLLIFPPLFMFPFEYWTYRSMRGTKSSQGDNYAEAIFKVFGFLNPGKINLLAHSKLSSGENGGWYAAWQGDKLLGRSS